MISVLFPLRAQLGPQPDGGSVRCGSSARTSLPLKARAWSRATLNPYVVKALQEDGIDISSHGTQDVFELYKAGRTYRYIITVCSREAAERCPIFPGRAERLHWPFPDPSTFVGTEEEVMAQVRTVRDAIRDKVKEFVAEVLAQAR